jgi:hypothetical protein
MEDRFFFRITNYQGFLNNHAHLYEFFFLEHKFKIKFEIPRNFELWEFWINQVLLYIECRRTGGSITKLKRSSYALYIFLSILHKPFAFINSNNICALLALQR